MKSVIKEGQEKSSYPCLKIHKTGCVVLFTQVNVGVVVKEGTLDHLGKFSDSFAEAYFNIFNGTIELSN